MTSTTDAALSAESIIQNLQELLQSSSDLRRIAEEQATQYRAALKQVAVGLCPERMDQARLDELEAAPLVQLIIDAVGDRLSELAWLQEHAQAGAADRTPPITLAHEAERLRLHARVQELEAELERSKSAARQQAEKIQALGVENAQLTARLQELEWLSSRPPKDAELLAPALAIAPATAPDLWPEWMQNWKASRGFDNDILLVQLVGSSLECRRSSLATILAQQKGISDSGNFNRLVMRLSSEMEPPLIDSHAGEGDKGLTGLRGRPSVLLSLTVAGRDAYRLLLGEEPRGVYDEYLRRHKSDGHILLVLAAIDLLEAYGYRVDRFPAGVTLPEGHVFAPDLTARQDDQTLAIEVETDKYKNSSERVRKWRNIAAATGGQIYVMTPDRKTMLALQSEIVSWSRDYSGRVSVHLTNLTELADLQRQQQPLPNGTIWLQNR